MKRVLVAGVVSGLLILATPALASSADRHGSGDGDRHSHSDNRGDRGRYDHDRYGYGYYYGDPYYYGGYDECHRDPSGSVTCEPYGGDYDPGGYNGGYPDPPPDPNYRSHPHSAPRPRCDDPRAANNRLPPGPGV